MNFIEDIAHPNLYWLILFLAILIVVKSAIGWIGNRKFQDVDDMLMAGFASLVDWQVAFGVSFLLWDGIVNGYGFSPYDIKHGIAMIAAAIVPHFFLFWRKADDRVRFRTNLLLILLSLVSIRVGIFIIRSVPIFL